MTKRVVVIVFVIAAAALVAVFHRPLIDWFSGAEPSGKPPAPRTVDHSASPDGEEGPGARGTLPELSPAPFAEKTLTALRPAYVAYEKARALLADDRVEGLAAPAREMERWLHTAHGDVTGDVEVVVTATAQAAGALATATDVGTARRHFATVSEGLIALAAADPRLAEGWHVYECPMTEGFNKWFQKPGDLLNPYMGKEMLACGSESEWGSGGGAASAYVAVGSHEGHGHEGTDIAHYTCSMHPSVKEQKPGACPICGMTLTPVTYDELEGGVIFVDGAKRQKIGVRTQKVSRGPMALDVRAVGKVVYDESRLHDVTLKYGGYVERLLVSETGQPVRRGQTLFYLYSPELYAAQQELIAATRSQSKTDYLVRAARSKLRLWDLTDRQIDAIVASGEPKKAVPFPSPATGFVIEKDVVEGAFVGEGMRIYRIASLDRVWVEAEVYEHELPLVEEGQTVTVTLPYQPGARYPGKVSYIYPYLGGMTRTGRIRVELANKQMELRPEMYANVEFRVELGERLRVPEEAVIYTGPRRIVFVDLGQSRLAPKAVRLGVKAGGYYEVLSGLREGETIVTSGNFLVASESRIRSSAFWSDGEPSKAPAAGDKGGSHGGHQH